MYDRIHISDVWLERDPSWVVDSAGTPWVFNGQTYDAAKALDGDTGTFWNPQGTDRNYNNWYIVLDLTAPHTITRVAVNNYGDTDHDIAAFTLQKSQGGSPYNWEDVVTVTNVQGGTDQRQEFGEFQGTARYWRFLITETYSGWQPWLRELDFYGVTMGFSVRAQSYAYDDPGFLDGPYGETTYIVVDGQKSKIDEGLKRGHQVFVLNEQTGQVVNKADFDTYGDAEAATKMEAFLGNLAQGRIIVVVVHDSGEQAGGQSSLAPYGSTITRLGHRESYAMITKKGPKPSWFVEKRSALRAGPTIVEAFIPTGR
ncbi:uncharacterized protein LOC144873864 [Branchiostoma floridae x Branchiostoma japonicum]